MTFWSCNTLKRNFTKTYIVLLPRYYASVKQGKALLKLFPNQQIQILNELPTDQSHIKVPQ